MNWINTQRLRFCSHIMFGNKKAHYKRKYKEAFERTPLFLEKIFQKAQEKAQLKTYKSNTGFFVFSDNRCIILTGTNYAPLCGDIFSNFDNFFRSVEPQKIGRFLVVDYSKPSLKKYIGFDLFPVYCPSYGEPFETNTQYTDFAELKEDSVVLDLGAFSGLTAILFDMEISKNNKKAPGKVISVEPDKTNIKCTEYNFSKYLKKTKRRIELCRAAAWKEDGEISFFAEGAMGSSAIAQVGPKTVVKAYKLSSIVKMYELEGRQVDFIKCDIEGGEIEIFKDDLFFEQFHPRIVVEPHFIDGTLCTEAVVKILEKRGYTVEVKNQDGFSLYPLIFAK